MSKRKRANADMHLIFRLSQSRACGALETVVIKNSHELTTRHPEDKEIRHLMRGIIARVVARARWFTWIEQESCRILHGDAPSQKHDPRVRGSENRSEGVKRTQA